MEAVSLRGVVGRDHRGHLERTRKELLVSEGIYESERTIALDISTCVKPGGSSVVVNCRRLQPFLRALVCNGKVEEVERVFTSLQCLLTREGSGVCPSLLPTPNADTSRAEDLESTWSRAACTGEHYVEARVGGRFNRKPERYCRKINGQLLSSQEVDDELEFPMAFAPTCTSVAELINSKCHGPYRSSSPTLLHCSILCGYPAMVNCLLRWGADVCEWLEADGDFYRYCRKWRFSPLNVAVILKQAGIVKQLLEHGASPYGNIRRLCFGHVYSEYMPDGPSNYSFCRRRNSAVLLALCSSPRFPPPFIDAARAYQYQDEHAGRTLRQCCRWNADLSPSTYSMVINCWRQWTPLLDTPCYRAEEVMCKMLFCLLVLGKVCSAVVYASIADNKPLLRSSSSAGSRALADAVRSLLQQGTDPTGGAPRETEELCRDWLRIRLPGLHCPYSVLPERWPHVSKISIMNQWTKMYKYREDRVQGFLQSIFGACIDLSMVLPSSPPQFCLRYGYVICYGAPLATVRLLGCQSVDDEVVKLLVDSGGIPGISSVAEIPYVDGHLHDGPSCQCGVELSPAQRNVKASDVLQLAPQAKSLSQLCRTAVIRACHSHGVVAAISKLNLPPVIADFLLFN
eukprot:scpid61636/ scgid19818/ 